MSEAISSITRLPMPHNKIHMSTCRINNNDVAAVCLHIAHNCNLSCEYCYADSGAFGGSLQLMSRRILFKAIDFSFAHSGDFKSVNVGFFGGEPLLNFKLIREAVKYARDRANTLRTYP